MVAAVAIPTIPKNGVLGILVNASEKKAAYNPITDQYIQAKCGYNQPGFLLMATLTPPITVRRLTTAAQ